MHDLEVVQFGPDMLGFFVVTCVATLYHPRLFSRAYNSLDCVVAGLDTIHVLDVSR